MNTKHCKYLLLPLYWIAVVWIYGKGYKASLVDDGNAAIIDFISQGWGGMLNNYGMTSLYHFHDLVNNLWYLIFGLNGKAWFLLTASLHALNSWLIFINMKTFYKKCGLKYRYAIAWIGSLMFLLSPYQSENIVWAATHHYGFALLFFMIMMRLVLHINDTNFLIYGVAVAVLYVISLMTREETLVYPGVFVAMFAVVKFFNPATSLSVKRFFTAIVLPQALLIITYFLLTKLIKGHWIPHYGTTHIENITMANYVTTLLQYLVKQSFFVHFLDYPARDWVYGFIRDKTALSLAIAFLVLSAIVVLLFIRNKRAWMVFGSLCISMVILFLPVLNLYFMYLFRYENDRMGYFGSIMLYQIVPLVFFSLLPALAYVVVMGWLMIAVYYSNIAAASWQQAGTFYQHCLSTLPQRQGRLFFLNVPLKYKDIYIFRSVQRIRNAYQLYYRKDNLAQLKPVAWANFHSPNDKLEILCCANDSMKIILRHTQPSWWMRNELGATNYENEDCRFEVDEWGIGYTFKVKDRKPDDSFWVTTADGFKELKM
jgi:hypothetical protein